MAFMLTGGLALARMTTMPQDGVTDQDEGCGNEDVLDQLVPPAMGPSKAEERPPQQ